jgi:hypothetical protein
VAGVVPAASALAPPRRLEASSKGFLSIRMAIVKFSQLPEASGYSQYVVSRRQAPKGRGHGPSRVDAHTAPHSSTPWSSTVAQLGSALDSSSRGQLINVRKNGFFVMEHRRSTNPYEASEVAC